MRLLDDIWYGGNQLRYLLTPLSAIFCAAVWVRRTAYRLGLLKAQRLGVPVVVVGNITVGGTGKTPLVIWLAEFLKTQGLRPGIVTRGYGGRSPHWPRSVKSDSDPVLCGDEPVVIARRTGCPVVAGPDRVAAARALLDSEPCDIIVSDDGLQHYSLARDVEIAVIDGERRLGSGYCLPAGPLREPSRRLREVDILVANGTANGKDEFPMRLVGSRAVKLQEPGTAKPIRDFSGDPVLAVAGIGNPTRFFRMLREHGLDVNARPFPDHHRFTPDDFSNQGSRPILMTEKDAVKCLSLTLSEAWFVPVEARLGDEFGKRLLSLINKVKNG